MTSDLYTVLVGILAAVFVASGAPKVRSPFRSALAIVRFGILRRIRPAVGRMLGFAELGLAAMLASGLLPRVTAVATLGVLAVFCGLLARALWRGNRFDCGCFGSHPVTLTYGTLGRTLFLGALAAAIVWGAFSGSPLLTGADRVLGLAAGALLVSLALVTAAVQRLGLFTESLSRFQDVARS